MAQAEEQEQLWDGGEKAAWDGRCLAWVEHHPGEAWAEASVLAWAEAVHLAAWGPAWGAQQAWAEEWKALLRVEVAWAGAAWGLGGQEPQEEREDAHPGQEVRAVQEPQGERHRAWVAGEEAPWSCDREEQARVVQVALLLEEEQYGQDRTKAYHPNALQHAEHGRELSVGHIASWLR